MQLPVLIDFWAPWCAPCRAMVPALEELEKKFEGRLVVKRVNVDDDPELAREHNVRSIPTLVLLNPDEKLRLIGSRPAATLEEEIAGVLEPSPQK